MYQRRVSRRWLFVLISMISLISVAFLMGNAQNTEANLIVIAPSKPEGLPWCDEWETVVAADKPTPVLEEDDFDAPATCMIRGEIIVATPDEIPGPILGGGLLETSPTNVASP